MARIPAEQRRHALVQAALAVIYRDGVAAATTRTIVAEADMSLASFHYVFGSRDELIREVIAAIVGDVEVAASLSLEPGRDIAETVRNGLRAYLEHVRADPMREVMLNELMNHALRDPELAHLPQAQYRIYRQTAAVLLELAATASNVRWNRPMDEMAHFFATFTDGLSLTWLGDRDDAAAERSIELAALAVSVFAEPVEPGAVEPDAVEPSADDPGAVVPGAADPGAADSGTAER